MQFEPRAAKVGGGCEGGVGGERWSLGRKKGEVWGRGWPGLREKTRDSRQDTGKRIDTGLEDDSGELRADKSCSQVPNRGQIKNDLKVVASAKDGSHV